jgi:serine/threonine protein kinase/Tol biopolymer transport system component
MTSGGDEDQRVMEILAAARRKPEGERAAYLRSACAGDEDLLREVADALSWEERMGEFLRQPVAMFVDENPPPGSEAVQFPAGFQIGQYLIESKLGEGGTSTVWLALDARLGRRVAIKFLSDNLADAEARRRFQREAQMASSLNHPHIVTVYDIGEFDGRQYLVTEYVDGGTLKDWAKHKRRTPQEVAELLTGVADGLAAAHQAGILHRDIKPLNILVARNGYAKLADFGLAKLAESGKFDLASHSPETPTRQGLILGTIAYMSPEQASGLPLDARSDIFSFGVVLYEMLFGRRPFAGHTDLELLKTIIHGELPPLSEEVPETYRNIVEKALEKNPAERYQSMREMVVDLRRGQRSPRSLAESGVASSHHLVEKPPPTPTRAGRTKVYYGVALLAVLLVAVSALLLWKAVLQPPRAPRVLSFTKLTSDGQTKLGPMVTDGSRIYFTEALPGPRNFVVQVSVKGGDTAPLIVPLKQPMVLDLSRDGTDLLLADEDVMEAMYQAHSLWLQPVAGGSPRRVGTVLAGSTGFGASAAFGAGGGSVVYALRHDIYSAALDGSSPHKILTTSNDHLSHPFAFRFSPDAKTLRFSQRDPEADSTTLMEAVADGTRLRKMFAGCCGEWTIDGRFFVFQNKLNGKSNLWTLPENRVQRLQNRDERPTQLTAGPLDFEYPLPSKDGKEIFAVGTSTQAEVVRYDARSGEFVSFLPGVSAEDLAFSQDGQWVVYASYPDGLLWRSKTDGSERLQLTFPPLQAELPRWSHDAKQIVFSAKFPDSVYNIYLVPSEGGAPQRILPSQQSQMDVNWSPDGSSLIFASDGAPNAPISLLDLQTKHVSTLPGSNGRFSPHWSPDGRYIAAIQADSQTLMLYDVATQSWQEIFGSTAGYETWSHDGKYIYFEGLTASDTSFRVFRFRLSDRKLEEVADMRKVGRMTAAGFDTWFGLAPDDSPLVNRDISTQEIYALEMDWP